MRFRINKARTLLLAGLAIFVAVKWLRPPAPQPTPRPTPRPAHVAPALPRGAVRMDLGDLQAESPTASAARSALELQAGQPGGHDLSRDEARGGHTLARHVGRTDEQLRERLALEEISAASTWPDRATAERIIALALTGNAKKISAWENRLGDRTNLALHYKGDKIIGRSLRHGAKETNACRDAVIVLKWTGTDWFVLTAYPEAR